MGLIGKIVGGIGTGLVRLAGKSATEAPKVVQEALPGLGDDFVKAAAKPVAGIADDAGKGGILAFAKKHPVVTLGGAGLGALVLKNMFSAPTPPVDPAAAAAAGMPPAGAPAGMPPDEALASGANMWGGPAAMPALVEAGQAASSQTASGALAGQFGFTNETSQA